MNARRTMFSWLYGTLIHLPREFSFGYMETTEYVTSECPTWGEYFMTLAGRVSCRAKDPGVAAKYIPPTWDDYFMGMAKLASLRSKDPRTKVGACIVNEDKIIVGIGYNSMPYLNSRAHVSPSGEVIQNDDVYPWDGKKGWEKEIDRETKYPYVCTAVLNAIVNKNTPSLKNCTVYTTLFPGNKDAQLIIQSGIIRVVYLHDKHHDKPFTTASRKLLQTSGVKLRYHRQLGKFQKGIQLIPETSD